MACINPLQTLSPSNEGAVVKAAGKDAPYVGEVRLAVDDESKAIRDMKTMNMLGKYSYSDLETRLEQSKSQAKEIYKKYNTAIKDVIRQIISSRFRQIVWA